MMEEEQANQPNSFRPDEHSEVTVPKSVQTQSFSSLLPKALSAILNPALHATSDPQPGRHPPGRTLVEVEQLRTELRDLRDQFNQMKTQHK